MSKSITWPEWLKAAIEASGKSPYQIAKESGRSHATISQQLNGQIASRKMVIDLATATYPSELAGGDEHGEGQKRHINRGLLAAGYMPDDDSITYITDPDAAIVAEAYEGLPAEYKGIVREQVLSAAGYAKARIRQEGVPDVMALAKKLDRKITPGAGRSDDDDNPTRRPED